jgi:hypothetical protein
VISFPKSGRTWFRVFLSGFLHYQYDLPFLLDFAFLRRLHKDVPRIVFRHGGHVGVFSEVTNAYIKKMSNRKILLLVRDPRDVVVSYYHELKKRNVPNSRDSKALKADTLSEFVRDKEYGIEPIVAFMNMWSENRSSFKEMSLVRYEDLMENPRGTFSKALDFFGIPMISEDALIKAVEFSSFENMRKLEEEDFFGDPRLRPENMHDKSSYKTRKGVVSGYKEQLGSHDVLYVNEQMSKLDPYFGYSTRNNQNLL